MNDIRRTILWVIFGFSMVLLWDQWQLFNGQKATFFPSATAPTKASPPAPVVLGNTGDGVPIASAAPAPAAANAAAVPLGAPVATQIARSKIVVTTDVFALTFDTIGGSLVKSSFVKFKDVAEDRKSVV